MIKSVTYQGLETGPRFLVIAAVHGNEKCGTVGCEQVMREIDAGELTIKRGTVTFVPIGNPEAYKAHQRSIDRNLNRFFVPVAEPDCYEAYLGNILCPMLADCDVHLSIHSYTVGGEAFVIAGPYHAEEYRFAACLGARTQLTGWAEAYAKTGRGALEKTGIAAEESTGTIEYARRHGALAVNIECGQHDDAAASAIAYRAIRNALRYLKLIDEVSQSDLSNPRLINVTHVYYHEDNGRFPKPWKHLEPLSAGAIMALRADGSPIIAPEDGVIIMPKANATCGEEWFYFGVEATA